MTKILRSNKQSLLLFESDFLAFPFCIQSSALCWRTKPMKLSRDYLNNVATTTSANKFVLLFTQKLCCCVRILIVVVLSEISRE